MKIAKFFSAIFGLLGLVAASACIVLSFLNVNSGPVLVKAPEEAQVRITELMEAVRSNDYETVSRLVQGAPDFGVDREPEDEVGALIWNAFIESMEYELNGELYATDSGVAQNITITALDVNSVTETLKDRSAALLEQRVNEAKNADEIYDENNEYRESFVMQTLYDAAAQALEEDARMVSQNVIINMVYDHGQWWIIADSQLLSVISGGVLK